MINFVIGCNFTEKSHILEKIRSVKFDSGKPDLDENHIHKSKIYNAK